MLLQGTLQQFVDDFFRSVLCSNSVVPPAVKYFFDFLDEQAQKHDNVDEETLHIWKTNRWDFLLCRLSFRLFSALALHLSIIRNTVGWNIDECLQRWR